MTEIALQAEEEATARQRQAEMTAQASRRRQQTEEAVALAQANNMAYIETSALDTTNVDTAFERVLAGTVLSALFTAHTRSCLTMRTHVWTS